MAKMFYVLHPEGDVYSFDKSKRYICLSGKELIRYLESPEGKMKRFYIEDDIGIEIPKEKISEFRKGERRKQYVAQIGKLHPYCCVSLFNELPEGQIFGEEAVKDESVSVEETALLNVMIESLRRALLALSESERMLVHSLYLDTPRLTQKEYAEKIGVSQQAVSKLHLAVLTKLKNHL